jgi:anti-anti-sigma factor
MATILNVRETDSAVIAMPRVMRFDLLETDQFRDELSALTSGSETKPLLIDLSQVEFLVSATLGVLVEVGKHCRDTSRPLALIRLKPKVLKVIQGCALDQLLAIHADEDEALATP